MKKRLLDILKAYCKTERMKTMKIQKVLATEILDSRGTPTVGATVILSDGSVGTANAPSGASTGKFEAHEKRDNDRKRYLGRGVKKAVEGIEETVAPVLENMQRVTVQNIDRMLIELDNTKNKEKLGANATLAVSLAAAKALAAHYKQPFFRYLGGTNAQKLPVPMMNILNGGAHAANNVDIQEFMIVPVGAKSFSEAVRTGSEIYHTLGGILKQRGLAVSVGDEGGFAPNLASDEEAIEVILEAVSSAGYTTDEVKIALDAAASEWTANDGYLLPKRGTKYTSAQLIAYWEKLCEKYPICSIEDPLGEEDWPAWTTVTEKLGKKIMLVGDDLFVTNSTRIRRGHRAQGRKRTACKAEPDRYTDGNACRRGACKGERHEDRHVAPLGRNGGHKHRGYRRCRKRRVHQIRRAVPQRPHRKIQPSAAHCKGK